jgi:NADH-quinone oxidoreductase subunit I
VLESNYELAYTDRASSIFTKEMLIVPVPQGGQATPQKVPAVAFDRSIPEMKDPA